MIILTAAFTCYESLIIACQCLRAWISSHRHRGQKTQDEPYRHSTEQIRLNEYSPLFCGLFICPAPQSCTFTLTPILSWNGPMACMYVQDLKFQLHTMHGGVDVNNKI